MRYFAMWLPDGKNFNISTVVSLGYSDFLNIRKFI